MSVLGGKIVYVAILGDGIPCVSESMTGIAGETGVSLSSIRKVKPEDLSGGVKIKGWRIWCVGLTKNKPRGRSYGK